MSSIDTAGKHSDRGTKWQGHLLSHAKAAFRWLVGLIATHALLLPVILVALHEEPTDPGWPWSKAAEHFYVSGEAALASVTVTAAALVALLWEHRGSGPGVGWLVAMLVAGTYVPPLVYPEVFMGKAAVDDAASVSVRLIIVGTVLGMIAEGMIARASLGGEDHGHPANS